MRDGQDPEDPAAGETPPDEPTDDHADVPSAVPRPWRRRSYQVVAAIGVVAALGAGVLVATHMDRRGTDARSGARVELGATPGTPAASAGVSPLPSVIPTPSPLRPLPPPTKVVDNKVVTVTSSGSLPKDRHTLRVVSARADLSGQRELAWAADSGHPVGHARCTQNLRFSPDAPAGERPTLLLCWRTSPSRSVVTVAVDLDRRPSEHASAVVIDKVWSKLG